MDKERKKSEAMEAKLANPNGTRRDSHMRIKGKVCKQSV